MIPTLPYTVPQFGVNKRYGPIGNAIRAEVRRTGEQRPDVRSQFVQARFPDSPFAALYQFWQDGTTTPPSEPIKDTLKQNLRSLGDEMIPRYQTNFLARWVNHHVAQLQEELDEPDLIDFRAHLPTFLQAYVQETLYQPQTLRLQQQGMILFPRSESP